MILRGERASVWGRDYYSDQLIGRVVTRSRMYAVLISTNQIRALMGYPDSRVVA